MLRGALYIRFVLVPCLPLDTNVFLRYFQGGGSEEVVSILAGCDQKVPGLCKAAQVSDLSESADVSSAAPRRISSIVKQLEYGTALGP